jgi:hypothetical protein
MPEDRFVRVVWLPPIHPASNFSLTDQKPHQVLINCAKLLPATSNPLTNPLHRSLTHQIMARKWFIRMGKIPTDH